MPSVDRQTLSAENLIWSHGPDLQIARNTTAAAARSTWLCFLDADDELDEHYLEAMTTAIADGDTNRLLQPATLGVYPDGREDPEPVLLPPKPLLEGNYLIIGTVVSAELFRRVGGFHDWPIWEDWDLWLRCWRAGAAVQPVPEAVYRVHVNANGRNNGHDRATQLRIYEEIRRRYSY